jgi:hypothetical protein
VRKDIQSEYSCDVCGKIELGWPISLPNEWLTYAVFIRINGRYEQSQFNTLHVCNECQPSYAAEEKERPKMINIFKKIIGK